MAKEIDYYDAQYPARKKAIEILEAIAEKLDAPYIFDVFDWKNHIGSEDIEPKPPDLDGAWFEYEDLVTEIIDRKEDSND